MAWLTYKQGHRKIHQECTCERSAYCRSPLLMPSFCMQHQVSACAPLAAKNHTCEPDGVDALDAAEEKVVFTRERRVYGIVPD
jgi:hypothetical protein